jgi:hypothetical protein
MEKVEAAAQPETTCEPKAESEIKSRILAKIAADVQDSADVLSFDRGSHDRYTKSP